MKFFALVAALCLAASTAHAAECTSQSFSSIDSDAELEKLKVACGSVLNSAKSISNEANAKDLQKKVCEDRTCINALQASGKIFPDCTMNGMNYKTMFAELMANIESECKKVTGSSSASTAAVGFSVATAAAVAVLAQL